MVETVRLILRKDGISAFWRGIGPALVLVVNPILQVGLFVRHCSDMILMCALQYTVFEQLKNMLVRNRTEKLKATAGAAATMAVLSDMDFFWLGAISKLGG
jgi:solute carrier family 25 (peroxisomal adenine nucleotide transporter), member 17